MVTIRTAARVLLAAAGLGLAAGCTAALVVFRPMVRWRTRETRGALEWTYEEVQTGFGPLETLLSEDPVPYVSAVRKVVPRVLSLSAVRLKSGMWAVEGEEGLLTEQEMNRRYVDPPL